MPVWLKRHLPTESRQPDNILLSKTADSKSVGQLSLDTYLLPTNALSY